MEDIIDKIKLISGADITVRRDNRIFVDVPGDKLIATLYSMKLLGFNQLSIMSAVDRIDDNEFELFYVLYNYKEKINGIVRARIARDKAVIETAANIYPPAYTYERELTEMFGIEVKGNTDSGKPFILENWNDKPPLLKDFESIEYVNNNYQFRHSLDKDTEEKDE